MAFRPDDVQAAIAMDAMRLPASTAFMQNMLTGIVRTLWHWHWLFM